MKSKVEILEDVDAMRRIDPGGMLQWCMAFPKFCREAVSLARKLSLGYAGVQRVIVAGMGGSAIGGEYLKQLFIDCPECMVPVEVCRDYFLPAYADEKVLVFVVSYSGETEEALNVFADALKRKCMIVCISSGGTVTRFAEKLKLPHIVVPSGLAPRAAFPYLFLPMPILMQKLDVAPGISPEIEEAIQILEAMENEVSPQKALEENPAKKLACELLETVPVFYGFRFYGAVAQRFKQQFNENSKVPCRWDVFPELNHNEIMGWEAPRKLTNLFSVVMLRDRDEPVEIRERIEATKALIRGKAGKILELWGKGTGRLAKMLSTTYIGDFASVYLAILRGVDPTPVKTIASLKQKMKKAGLKVKAEKELKRFAASETA